jgi:hypothetical protein
VTASRNIIGKSLNEDKVTGRVDNPSAINIFKLQNDILQLIIKEKESINKITSCVCGKH